MKTSIWTPTFATLLSLLAFQTMFVGAPRLSAQNSTPTSEPTARASLDPEIPPALARQLAAMQAEIDILKAELRGRTETTPPSVSATATVAPAAGAEVKAAPSESTSAAGN